MLRRPKMERKLLFPAPLSQICFVLVLISPNHKARNRYPEMVMARTANASHQGEETQMKHSQALKHPQQISSAKQILSRTPKSRENDLARVKAPRFRAMLGEDKMTHYPVLLARQSIFGYHNSTNEQVSAT